MNGAPWCRPGGAGRGGVGGRNPNQFQAPLSEATLQLRGATFGARLRMRRLLCSRGERVPVRRVRHPVSGAPWCRPCGAGRGGVGGRNPNQFQAPLPRRPFSCQVPRGDCRLHRSPGWRWMMRAMLTWDGGCGLGRVAWRGWPGGLGSWRRPRGAGRGGVGGRNPNQCQAPLSETPLQLPGATRALWPARQAV